MAVSSPATGYVLHGRRVYRRGRPPPTRRAGSDAVACHGPDPDARRGSNGGRTHGTLQGCIARSRISTPVSMRSVRRRRRRVSCRLIVRRPGEDRREPLDEALFDVDEGLVGDSWRARGNRHTPDGAADPQAQLTLVNARAAAAIAGDPERWALAGDQLYVDLDLSVANLPAGTRLRIGGAEIEISAKPHTGCAKFSARFGPEALRFVSSPEGRALRLRGVNARVISGGPGPAGRPHRSHLRIGTAKVPSRRRPSPRFPGSQVRLTASPRPLHCHDHVDHRAVRAQRPRTYSLGAARPQGLLAAPTTPRTPRGFLYPETV